MNRMGRLATNLPEQYRDSGDGVSLRQSQSRPGAAVETIADVASAVSLLTLP